MSPKVLVPLIITIIVAVALLGVGIWAKSAAPEGANAMTAIYVNGGAAAILILLGVAGAAMQANARNIFAIAAIVCLLITGAVGGQIYPKIQSQKRYEKAIEQWNRAVAEKKRPDNPDAKIKFLTAETDLENNGGGQTHDKQYVINAFGVTAGIALLGCLLIFATRPKAE